MRRFYRIEDCDRVGCYHSTRVPHNDSYQNPSERHPMPQDDSLLTTNKYNIEALRGYYWFSSVFRYGFNSLEQLRSWFYEDSALEMLHNCGFVLAIYEIPEMIEGHTQCIMLDKYHNDERRIEEISLLSLLTPTTT